MSDEGSNIDEDTQYAKDKTDWTAERKLLLALACNEIKGHVKTKTLTFDAKWTNILVKLKSAKAFKGPDNICQLYVDKPMPLKNTFLRFQKEELKDLFSPTVNLSGKDGIKSQYRLLMEQMWREMELEKEKKKQEKVLDKLSRKRNKQLATQTMLYSCNLGSSTMPLETSVLSNSSGSSVSNQTSSITQNRGGNVSASTFLEKLDNKISTFLDDDDDKISSAAPTELESEQLKAQKLQNEILELKKLKYQMQVDKMKKRSRHTNGVDSESSSDSD